MLARFARNIYPRNIYPPCLRLLRHALPISLLILRIKPRLFCSLGLMQLVMNTAIPALLETEGVLSSSFSLPLAKATLNLFSELLS